MKKICVIILCLIAVTSCQKPGDTKKPDYKDQIAELLEKSYTLSLFSYGTLDLEEAVTVVEDKTYNLVNSEIKNLNELNSLLEEVYVSERYNQFYEKLYAKKDFLGIDNKIYVNDHDESCDIGKDYDFTDFKISETTEDYLIIDHEEFSYYVFIRDGKLYLSDDVFKCLETKRAMLEEKYE